MKITTMTSRRGFLCGISVSGLGLAVNSPFVATTSANPVPPAEAKMTEIDEALGNYPPYDAKMPGGKLDGKLRQVVAMPQPGLQDPQLVGHVAKGYVT